LKTAKTFESRHRANNSDVWQLFSGQSGEDLRQTTSCCNPSDSGEEARKLIDAQRRQAEKVNASSDCAGVALQQCCCGSVGWAAAMNAQMVLRLAESTARIEF